MKKLIPDCMFGMSTAGAGGQDASFQEKHAAEETVANNLLRPILPPGQGITQPMHHFLARKMGKAVAVLLLVLASVQFGHAQQNNTKEEQELISLSKAKWQWMADKRTDTLAALFHDRSMFVHMGGSWGKTQELDVIKTGSIWYKQAEVYTVTVNIIGNTAILLNDIDLVAVVGGNEVVNPFMVTEVYVKEQGGWKMGSLTFSRLMRPVKLSSPSAKPQ